MYYYQCEDSISNYFFMVPKSLFSDKYAAISANAKIMYIHMLDRCKLSMKNKWVDEAKNIFIIYTIEQLVKLMHLKKSKIHMLLNELEEYQLIKRRRTGGTYPNQIYVANLEARNHLEKSDQTMCEVASKNICSDNGAVAVHKAGVDDIEKPCAGMPEYLREKLNHALSNSSEAEKRGVDASDKTENDIHDFGHQRMDIHKCEHQNAGVKSNDVHEYGLQNHKIEANDIHNYGGQSVDIHKPVEKSEFDIQKYGHQMAENDEKQENYNVESDDVHNCGGQPQIDVHETGILMSTFVNPSNNINNNNNNIDACARVRDAGASSIQVDIEAIKHQIGYGALVQQHPEDIDAIEAIVSVMTDMAAVSESSEHAALSIGDRSAPIKDIKSRYASLTIYDINNVLRAAKGKTIKNLRKYFTVCLYNAKSAETSNRWNDFGRDEFKSHEDKRQAFCNFKGRNLAATIEALEMLQAKPQYATAF